eukprot:gene2472-5422_t
MAPYQNEDWRLIYKGHPCYNPEKDLVIPGFKIPSHFDASPLLGAAPAENRHLLLFFRGDCGHNRLPQYSRGIRQKVWNLSRTHEWQTKHNIIIGTRKELTGTEWEQSMQSFTAVFLASS